MRECFGGPCSYIGPLGHAQLKPVPSEELGSRRHVELAKSDFLPTYIVIVISNRSHSFAGRGQFENYTAPTLVPELEIFLYRVRYMHDQVSYIHTKFLPVPIDVVGSDTSVAF